MWNRVIHYLIAGIRQRWTLVSAGIVCALVAIIAVPATAVAQEPPWFLEPASEQASMVAWLHNVELLIATGVFVIVEGLIVFFAIRYRRKQGDDEAPPQIHGNNALEISWTVGTAVVLVLVFAVFWQTMSALAAEPDEGLTIDVYGHQWWWEFQYADYTYNLDGQDTVVRTGNELYIPADTPIKLRLHSDNVIHSFWVPRLSGKQDVIPGQTNTLWFQADEAGSYYGQCAELCGVQHAGMRLRVFALEQDEWEQWIADQQEPAQEPQGELAQQGQQLFTAKGCAGCHAIAGTNAQGRLGPDLTHFASRTTIASVVDQTDQNLGRWVFNSELIKPGNTMWQTMKDVPLSSNEVNALVAYLNTLE